MWLKLDLGGIDFEFRISGYKKSTKNWEYEWSKVDLALIAKDWLNYRLENDEILLMCEIEDLRDNVGKLLNDELCEVVEIGGIEPDMTFILHPKYDRRENPHCLYVAPGYEFSDIGMSLEIAFCDDGLTANRLVLYFCREDLEMLLCYLQLITGEIDEQNENVQKLIKLDNFY